MSCRFAANLSHLWPELPYLDRFEAAANAGFTGVEVLFPYDLAVKETQRAALAQGVDFVLLNAPPPNYAGGDQGWAADPALTERFRRDISRAFRYAEALGATFVHVMSGPGEGEAAKAAMIENLAFACDAAPKGLRLSIEPLNPVSMPGYFLNDYGLAAEVIAAVDAPNLALQYDSFHAQMIHGDALAVFDRYQALIGHIQIGDAPGRGAPGSGTVDFEGLFARIKASGYDGWVSAEYTPGGRTEDTLGWMRFG